MSDASVAAPPSVPAEALGGPGQPSAVQCSAVAVWALEQVAGPGLRMTSLALEIMASVIGAGEVLLHTYTDKRARSILFASVEARAGDQLVFTAQGLFGPAVPKT